MTFMRTKPTARPSSSATMVSPSISLCVAIGGVSAANESRPADRYRLRAALSISCRREISRESAVRRIKEHTVASQFQCISLLLERLTHRNHGQRTSAACPVERATIRYPDTDPRLDLIEAVRGSAKLANGRLMNRTHLGSVFWPCLSDRKGRGHSSTSHKNDHVGAIDPAGQPRPGTNKSARLSGWVRM
jgi:hypothetical protein